MLNEHVKLNYNFNDRERNICYNNTCPKEVAEDEELLSETDTSA